MKCTKVNCSFTSCKYNSSCCVSPTNPNTYCTLKEINLEFNEECGIMECVQFEEDYNKLFECINCQLEKYGDIELDADFEFIEVDNIEDLFK